MKVKIATFNVENLFLRYDFKKGYVPVKQNGFTINDLAYETNNKAEKEITAQVIKTVDADIICL
jgi:hypothetical protein